MQIKRFKAQDMSAALAQIKKEFGPDAVILSARDTRHRVGMLGMPRITGVEVTAAIDPGTPEVAAARVLTGGDAAAVTAGSVQDVVRLSGPRGIRRALETGMNVFRKRGESMTGKPSSETAAAPAESQRLHERLTAGGVRPAVASKLNDRIRRLSGSRSGAAGLAGALSAMGLDAEALAGDAERRITVVAGPSGTGKTTVLAKLAARAVAGHRVGLITLDQQRIGAVAQIRIYADILGVPLEMAADAAELTVALDRLALCDRIFIDTPGLSPRNAFQIHALKSTLAAAAGARTLLVFSATTKDDDLDGALERYQALGIDALVFTRIDESHSFGTLINLAVAADRPLAYFCNGPQVPEDLEAATAERIGDLVLHPEADRPVRAGRVEPAPRKAAPRRADAVAAETEAALPAGSPESDMRFVANRNSDIFHRPDCKWTRVIKRANMVVFRSVEEARERKYSPCRYCTPVTVEAFRPMSQIHQQRSVGGAR